MGKPLVTKAKSYRLRKALKRWRRRKRRLFSGNVHVSVDDIQALVRPTFRHRILVGYRAEAEGVSVDDVIDKLLEHVKTPGR